MTFMFEWHVRWHSILVFIVSPENLDMAHLAVNIAVEKAEQGLSFPPRQWFAFSGGFLAQSFFIW